MHSIAVINKITFFTENKPTVIWNKYNHLALNNAFATQMMCALVAEEPGKK